MTKAKILIFIPFLLTTGLVVNCWTNFLVTEAIATWRHYAGLLLFCPLYFLFLKSISQGTLGLGVYLLLATFNLIAFTPTIKTSWFTINTSNPISTPPVQLVSLGLFLLYFVLNLDSLINIHLDYKEAKAKRHGWILVLYCSNCMHVDWIAVANFRS